MTALAADDFPYHSFFNLVPRVRRYDGQASARESGPLSAPFIWSLGKAHSGALVFLAPEFRRDEKGADRSRRAAATTSREGRA